MRKFSGDRLLVATHNKGKLDEIIDLFKGRSLAISSAGELGLPEPAETAGTFVGNARIKAHAAAQASGMVSLADDSGLCVDALNGQPGVYSADWAEFPGGRNFDLAMERVCTSLDELGAFPNATAYFMCTLVLAWPDGHDEVFEGRIDGRIVCPGRGLLGHGYDPIFQPDGYDLTFGEMDRWEKNRISHRAAAFRQLLECFT
jgi:XTP/dITP diphosphohydrolase